MGENVLHQSEPMLETLLVSKRSTLGAHLPMVFHDSEIHMSSHLRRVQVAQFLGESLG